MRHPNISAISLSEGQNQHKTQTFRKLVSILRENHRIQPPGCNRARANTPISAISPAKSAGGATLPQHPGQQILIVFFQQHGRRGPAAPHPSPPDAHPNRAPAPGPFPWCRAARTASASASAAPLPSRHSSPSRSSACKRRSTCPISCDNVNIRPPHARQVCQGIAAPARRMLLAPAGPPARHPRRSTAI